MTKVCSFSTCKFFQAGVMPLFSLDFVIKVNRRDKERKSRKAFQVIYQWCLDCDRAWIQANEGLVGIPKSMEEECEKRGNVIRLTERNARKREDAPRGAKKNCLNNTFLCGQLLSRDTSVRGGSCFLIRCKTSWRTFKGTQRYTQFYFSLLWCAGMGIEEKITHRDLLQNFIFFCVVC